MSGKGSGRRPESKRGNYHNGYDRAFRGTPVECPYCKEIELRPTGDRRMWNCDNCKAEVQA